MQGSAGTALAMQSFARIWVRSAMSLWQEQQQQQKRNGMLEKYANCEVPAVNVPCTYDPSCHAKT